MKSLLLCQYLRTGAIPPLAKGDTKDQVEAKLGPPDDWFGRRRGFNWHQEPLTNFHDSWAWHYGALCICFPDFPGLPGISLDYSEILKPICFRPPFDELPSAGFTIRELIDLLDANEIQYEDTRGKGYVLSSEGGIAAISKGDRGPNDKITNLFPDHLRQFPFRAGGA